MANALKERKLYAKGTMSVKLFDPSTNELLYFTDKVITNQLQSSANLGAINAGIGNPTVIQIPDTASLTLTLTSGDFSLAARALSVGSRLTYGGIVPVEEVVAAESTTLKVAQPPCAPIGGCDIVGYIDGAVYKIDPQSMEVQGFTAVNGTSYCVHYYTKSAQAQQFSMDALLIPAIVRALITIPLYATDSSDSASNRGSQVGSLYITIPRMQFNGDIATEGSQTTPATTNLTGTALSYDETCEQGIICTAASPKLAYMVVEMNGTPDQFVTSLGIVGGNSRDIVGGEDFNILVKYVLQDGALFTPLMSNLTFEVEDGKENVATVSPLGVVTGVSPGTAIIRITSKFNTNLTTTFQVSVSSLTTRLRLGKKDEPGEVQAVLPSGAYPVENAKIGDKPTDELLAFKIL